MKVGPIAVEDDFTNGKVKVTNVENLWQFSKVWDGETDAKGNPTLVGYSFCNANYCTGVF